MVVSNDCLIGRVSCMGWKKAQSSSDGSFFACCCVVGDDGRFVGAAHGPGNEWRRRVAQVGGMFWPR
jgi:hypothetical protein